MKLPNFDDWSNGEHWAENKVIYKLMLSKYVNNKKYAPKFVFFNEKKSERFG